MPRSRAMLLAVAALGLAVNAAEPGKIEMHRSGAGTFTADAWVRAESTEGRYSVLMPARFDDYTQKSNKGDNRNGYFLRAKMPDQTVVGAVRAEYADAAEARRICLKVREASAFGANLKSKRTFQVDGRDAVELTTNDGRVWQKMRVICLETEGMIMSVVALVDQIPQAEALSGKFFDSLRIGKD